MKPQCIKPVEFLTASSLSFCSFSCTTSTQCPDDRVRFLNNNMADLLSLLFSSKHLPIYPFIHLSHLCQMTRRLHVVQPAPPTVQEGLFLTQGCLAWIKMSLQSCNVNRRRGVKYLEVFCHADTSQSITTS